MHSCPADQFWVKEKKILTHKHQIPIVLQYHIPVQGPLSSIRVSPFNLGKGHSHIPKCQWSLQNQTQFRSPRNRWLPCPWGREPGRPHWRRKARHSKSASDSSGCLWGEKWDTVNERTNEERIWHPRKADLLQRNEILKDKRLQSEVIRDPSYFNHTALLMFFQYAYHARSTRPGICSSLT